MNCAISRPLLDRLLAEAEAAGRLEVCGLLTGAEGLIDGAVAIPNAAADPERGFLLDPGAHLAASRALRAEGKAVVGHYHSHPSGDPQASAADAAAALEPGLYWLIIGKRFARLYRARHCGEVQARLVPIEMLQARAGNANRG